MQDSLVTKLLAADESAFVHQLAADCTLPEHAKEIKRKLGSWYLAAKRHLRTVQGPCDVRMVNCCRGSPRVFENDYLDDDGRLERLVEGLFLPRRSAKRRRGSSCRDTAIQRSIRGVASCIVYPVQRARGLQRRYGSKLEGVQIQRPSYLAAFVWASQRAPSRASQCMSFTRRPLEYDGR